MKIDVKGMWILMISLPLLVISYDLGYLWRNLDKSHVNQSLRTQEKVTPRNVYSHEEPPVAVSPNSDTSPCVDDVIVSTVGDSQNIYSLKDMINTVHCEKRGGTLSMVGFHRITQSPYGLPSCGWDSFIEHFADKLIPPLTFASLGNSFSYNHCSCKNNISQTLLVIWSFFYKMLTIIRKQCHFLLSI